ncbi:hypothetical protein FOE78_06360 [Microlunatus elymi]|uniref:Uncharacterized protein n=1 Tax=Microlunatus elymi TaxID=2596828 RepID=A0A516PWP3_9ACTN|nr:hypothetical protein [Microlunatus elymi]QDP95579.1 hypothetical protein FOE78_06360 [Microlunatus elymi]
MSKDQPPDFLPARQSSTADQPPTAVPPQGLDPQLLARYGHPPSGAAPAGPVQWGPYGPQQQLPVGPRPNIRRRVIIVLAIILAAALCLGALAYLEIGEFGRQSKISKGFVTHSGCCQLTATKNWTEETDPSTVEGTDLMITEGVDDYIAVYAYPGTDFDSFSDFVDASQTQWQTKAIGFPVVVGPQRQVGPLPSRQLTVGFPYQGTNVYFWINLIDGENGHFYQVAGWTTQDHKESHQEQITTVMDSFRIR